jgi:hypothetical protein
VLGITSWIFDVQNYLTKQHQNQKLFNVKLYIRMTTFGKVKRVGVAAVMACLKLLTRHLP